MTDRDKAAIMKIVDFCHQKALEAHERAREEPDLVKLTFARGEATAFATACFYSQQVLNSCTTGTSESETDEQTHSQDSEENSNDGH